MNNHESQKISETFEISKVPPNIEIILKKENCAKKSKIGQKSKLLLKIRNWTKTKLSVKNKNFTPKVLDSQTAKNRNFGCGRDPKFFGES